MIVDPDRYGRLAWGNVALGTLSIISHAFNVHLQVANTVRLSTSMRVATRLVH